VVFLPYLLGERTPVWDPDARGAWVGMSTTTGRSDLIRAVFESAGYGIRQIMELEEQHSGSKIDEVLLVGGGARSRFWTQLKADITGRVYRRAEDVESACRGAALLAAVGAGAHGDPWSAVREAGPSAAERIEPTGEPAVREVYDRAYAAYAGLYPALRETFAALTPKTEQGGP
jgi:xylulokinase